VAVVDGTEQVEEIERDLSGGLADAPIVELSRGKKTIKRKCEIFQNRISFIDNGELPVGTYDITVLLNWEDGGKMRYKKRTLLQIVDTTAEGGQYDNDEFNVVAIYPIVEGETTAIIVGNDDVTISENGKFQGDDTPNDEYADVSSTYGQSNIEIEDDYVTLNI